MKKKILTLFFLVLFSIFSLIGCSKNKEVQEAQDPTPTPTSTPTPAPAEIVGKQLHDTVDKLLSTVSSSRSEHRDSIGMDLELKVSIGESLTSLIGISDLQSAGLKMGFDAKDSLSAVGTLYLNDESLLDFSAFADAKNLFFNLPKYSHKYLSTSFDELLSMGGTSAPDGEPVSSDGVLPFMPKSYSQEDVLRIYREFIDDIVRGLHSEGMEKNVSFGTIDYNITADKYAVSIATADLKAAYDRLAASLGMPSFDELDFPSGSGESAPFSGSGDFSGSGSDNGTSGAAQDENDTITTLYCNYYKGSDGTFGLELYPDTEPNEPLCLVSAKRGFCLYGVSGGTADAFIYSEKKDETSGTIYIAVGGGKDASSSSGYTYDDSDDFFTFEYSNFSKNGVDLTGTVEDTDFTLSLKKTGDNVTMKFSVENSSMTLSSTVTGNDKSVECTIDVSSLGMNLASIYLTMGMRNYKPAELPTDCLNTEAWTSQLDTNTILGDLLQLMQKYPSLGELLSGLIS